MSARLACIRHAASVRPEPGSNSQHNRFQFASYCFVASVHSLGHVPMYAPLSHSLCSSHYLQLVATIISITRDALLNTSVYFALSACLVFKEQPCLIQGPKTVDVARFSGYQPERFIIDSLAATSTNISCPETHCK